MTTGSVKLLGPHALSPEIIGQGDLVDFGQIFLRARRLFLDALPFPGALFAKLDGGERLVDLNQGFRALGDDAPLVDQPIFLSYLKDFLDGSVQIADHDWQDGDAFTGRSYTIRFSRLRLAISDAPACLVTLIDRTAERATERSLRLEMFNDSLTGLPNRASFAEQLASRLTVGETDLAVLAVDLTRFSRINESMGAIAGDELLLMVARRLLSALRGGDLLARIGGNEFGIIAKIEGPEDPATIAQRVNAVLTAPCRLSDLEIRIGSAIGCARPEPDCDADEVIRRAQFALKRAKRTGEFEIYQPRAHDLACHQFTLETKLRRAIDAERLTLALQPVIDLASGRVAGFEALARWNDEGVDVPPSTFVPVAEESGLILPLGRWAIEASLRILSDWDRRETGERARIAVNLSSIQIARDDVPGLLEGALTRHGIVPDRLMLELTESAIVADPDRAARAMHRIRDIGAAIALDDFGTGYSNLAYLQRLPIDMLKIDQSFVTGMLGDRDKVAIVRAILSLSEALGLQTTAEGVETPQLARALAALGCTRGQGYFYASPLEPEAAFAYWRESNSAAT